MAGLKDPFDTETRRKLLETAATGYQPKPLDFQSYQPPKPGGLSMPDMGGTGQAQTSDDDEFYNRLRAIPAVPQQQAAHPPQERGFLGSAWDAAKETGTAVKDAAVLLPGAGARVVRGLAGLGAMGVSALAPDSEAGQFAESFAREASLQNKDSTEYWKQYLSPESQHAMDTEILSNVKPGQTADVSIPLPEFFGGGDYMLNQGNLRTGDLLRKFLLMGAESAPATVGGMAIGAKIAGGLAGAAGLRGVAEAGMTAGQKAAMTGINSLAYGGSEGIMAGAANATDVYGTIAAMPIESLRKVPVFSLTVDQMMRENPGMSREIAEDRTQTQFARESGLETAITSGLSTAAFGAPFGNVSAMLSGGLARAIGRGNAANAAIPHSFGKGLALASGSEALQEAMQSPLEALSANLALAQVDPELAENPYRGVGEAALSGLVLGGAMGGGMHTVGALARRYGAKPPEQATPPAGNYPRIDALGGFDNTEGPLQGVPGLRGFQQYGGGLEQARPPMPQDRITPEQLDSGQEIDLLGGQEQPQPGSLRNFPQYGGMGNAGGNDAMPLGAANDTEQKLAAQQRRDQVRALLQSRGADVAALADEAAKAGAKTQADYDAFFEDAANRSGALTAPNRGGLTIPGQAGNPNIIDAEFTDAGLPAPEQRRGLPSPVFEGEIYQPPAPGQLQGPQERKALPAPEVVKEAADAIKAIPAKLFHEAAKRAAPDTTPQKAAQLQRMLAREFQAGNENAAQVAEQIIGQGNPELPEFQRVAEAMRQFTAPPQAQPAQLPAPRREDDRLPQAQQPTPQTEAAAQSIAALPPELFHRVMQQRRADIQPAQSAQMQQALAQQIATGDSQAAQAAAKAFRPLAKLPEYRETMERIRQAAQKPKQREFARVESVSANPIPKHEGEAWGQYGKEGVKRNEIEDRVRAAYRDASKALPPGFKTVPYKDDYVSLQDLDGNVIAYPLTADEAAERAWAEAGIPEQQYAQAAALKAELAPEMAKANRFVAEAKRYIDGLSAKEKTLKDENIKNNMDSLVERVVQTVKDGGSTARDIDNDIRLPQEAVAEAVKRGRIRKLGSRYVVSGEKKPSPATSRENRQVEEPAPTIRETRTVEDAAPEVVVRDSRQATQAGNYRRVNGQLIKADDAGIATIKEAGGEKLTVQKLTAEETAALAKQGVKGATHAVVHSASGEVVGVGMGKAGAVKNATKAMRDMPKQQMGSFPDVAAGFQPITQTEIEGAATVPAQAEAAPKPRQRIEGAAKTADDVAAQLKARKIANLSKNKQAKQGDTDYTSSNQPTENGNDSARNSGNSDSTLEEVLPQERSGNASQGRDTGEGSSGNRQDGTGRDAGVSGARDDRGGSVASLPGNRAERPGKGVKPEHEQTENLEAVNYRITDADRLGEGGRVQKIKDNLEAIRIIKAIEKEGRAATDAEKAKLVRYVGWGGLKNVFDPTTNDNAAKKAGDELKEILTESEWKAAMASTLNAHYTASPVINAMYKIVEHFGFSGGRVLEPTVGTGNFIGLMPENLAAQSKWYASELDAITSRIAAQLYPRANILTSTGFQEAEFPYGKFDLAIGNPPFGDERLTDRSKTRAEISGFKIHNHIIAKSGMHLKPNGIMAMVVTSRFLDAKNDEARDYLSKKFDFLGAIRLPNTSFKASAGTEVTTDIVFFRRRMPKDAPGNMAWLETGATMQNARGETVTLNKYFADKPEMMLGIPSMKGSMYAGNREEFTLETDPAIDIEKAIDAIIESGEFAQFKNVAQENHNQAEDVAAVEIEMNRRDVSIGGYVLDNGKVFMREDDDADGNVVFERVTPLTKWTEKAALGQTRFERIKGMLELRELTYDLIRAERADVIENMINNKRTLLVETYDDFVKKFGFINDPANSALMDGDIKVEFGLETNYRKPVSAAKAKRAGLTESKAKADKASILSQRVFFPYREIKVADNARDGYPISLSERGKLDLQYIADLTDTTVDQVVKELSEGDKPMIFRDPDTKEWIEGEKYLSGNVKEKYKKAFGATGYEANVKALKEVFPKDLTPEEVFVEMGATWLPPNVYETFLAELGISGARVYVSGETGRVSVTGYAGESANELNVLLKNKDYGITGLFELLANKQPVVAYDFFKEDGKERKVANAERTQELSAVAKGMKQMWKDWLFSDPQRRDSIVKLYNDTMNTHAPRQYDGNLFRMVGANPAVQMRDTQKNAAWRMVQSKTTLLDHVVGAGKTFTVIAGVMERKRLGLSNKSMIIVPNHLVGQWAKDFLTLYPGANIISPSEKDFEKKNRRRLFARIATGKYDAVIVGHSSLKKIPLNPEKEAAFIESELEHLYAALNEAKTNDDKRTVRSISNSIEKRRERIKKLQDIERDDTVQFDDLGVDFMVIDESHEFKNLEYATAMKSITGMGDPKGAQKAFDLYMKLRTVLDSKSGGAAFATGTPISNSLVEMYSILRYLNGNELESRGLKSFDAWAKAYAEIDTRDEITSTQKIKTRTVMASFNNLPELLQLYSEFADTVTMTELKRMYALQVRAKNKATGGNEREEFPVPKVYKHKRQLEVAAPSTEQKEFMDSLVARAEKIEEEMKSGKFDPSADNLLWVMSDARKMALDIRIVDPAAPDNPNSKVNRAAKNIKALYDQWNADKGTQLVYSDLSTPVKTSKKDADALIADAMAVAGLSKDGGVSAAMKGLTYQDKWTYLMDKMDKMIENELVDSEKAEAIQEWREKLPPDELAALTAADTGFSVYDDLKAKLIAAGIPANEIKFIHDANSRDDKTALFEQVNDGNVRVLIGSSSKMGPGMNAQKRLVALHHLDAPWRPSDVEQREGRIIRQGNTLYMRDPDNFEVDIRAYSTSGTFDSVMWQILARKAEMLEQFRSGARSMAEESGDSASYSEFMAESTGNPAYKERHKLTNEVAELEATMRRATMLTKSSRRIVDEADTMLGNLNKAIETAKADYAAVRKGKLVAEFGGRKYSFDVDTAIAEEESRYQKAKQDYDEKLLEYTAAVESGNETDKKPKKPTEPSQRTLHHQSLVKNSEWLQMINALGEKAREDGDATAMLNGIPLYLEAQKTKRDGGGYTYTIQVGESKTHFSRVESFSEDTLPLNTIERLSKTTNIISQLGYEAKSLEDRLKQTQNQIEAAKKTLKKSSWGASDTANLETKKTRLKELSDEINGLEEKLSAERAQSDNKYIGSRAGGGKAGASSDQGESATATVKEDDARIKKGFFTLNGAVATYIQSGRNVTFDLGEDAKGERFFIFKQDDGIFNITHADTGLRVTFGATESDAIRTAADLLSKNDIAEIVKKVKKITDEQKIAALAEFSKKGAARKSMRGDRLIKSGVSKAKVESLIAPVIANWKAKGFRVRVVQSEADLMQALPHQRGSLQAAGGGIEGLYDPQSGALYLVADNLSEGRVLPVLAHESVGHWASENLIDPGFYQNALRSVAKLEAKGDKDVIRWLGRVDASQPGLKQTDNEMRYMEALAQAAESGEYKNVPLSIQRVINDLVNYIKAALRRIGFSNAWVNTLNRGELLQMLRTAEQRLQLSPDSVFIDSTAPAAPRVLADAMPSREALETAYLNNPLNKKIAGLNAYHEMLERHHRGERVFQKAQASIDVDDLGGMNSVGTEFADELLIQFGDIMKRIATRVSGGKVEVIHLHGDEFYVQGTDTATVNNAMDEARQEMSRMVFETKVNGVHWIAHGLNFGWGVQETGKAASPAQALRMADNKLNIDKANRRAKGYKKLKGLKTDFINPASLQAVNFVDGNSIIRGNPESIRAALKAGMLPESLSPFNPQNFRVPKGETTPVLWQSNDKMGVVVPAENARAINAALNLAAKKYTGQFKYDVDPGNVRLNELAATLDRLGVNSAKHRAGYGKLKPEQGVEKVAAMVEIQQAIIQAYESTAPEPAVEAPHEAPHEAMPLAGEMSEAELRQSYLNSPTERDTLGRNYFLDENERGDAGKLQKNFAALGVRDMAYANDNTSHATGDAMIKAFAQAFNRAGKASGIELIHMGGGDFYAQHQTGDKVALERFLRDALPTAMAQVELADFDEQGTPWKISGLQFDYQLGAKGKGETSAAALKRANGEMSERKKSEEASGNRLGKGKKPDYINPQRIEVSRLADAKGNYVIKGNPQAISATLGSLLEGYTVETAANNGGLNLRISKEDAARLRDQVKQIQGIENKFSYDIDPDGKLAETYLKDMLELDPRMAAELSRNYELAKSDFPRREKMLGEIRNATNDLRRKNAGNPEGSRKTDSTGRITDSKINPGYSAGRAAQGGLGSEEAGKGKGRLSFAGSNAETADLTELRVAVEMLEAGEDADTVRKETGWFKGADGKFRFEIDDSKAVLVAPQKNAETWPITWKAKLGDILSHDRLFAAYPQLRDIDVRGETGMGDIRGNVLGNLIRLNTDISQIEQLSTLLHEIQHGIQVVEDFAGGGNPKDSGVVSFAQESLAKEKESAKSVMDEMQSQQDGFARRHGYDTMRGMKDDLGASKFDPYIKQFRVEFPDNFKRYADAQDIYTKESPDRNDLYRAYKRLYGEVEARNVQSRMGMNEAQRLKKSPAKTQDTPDSEVIIRWNGKDVQASVNAPENAAAAIPYTLEVDGVTRPTRNSNGQPIHETVEGINNFWRWFGESKVVDSQGRPLVVYHGTDADFNVFDIDKTGAASDEGWYGRGFYFSPSANEANDYAYRESGSNVIPAYLKIESPYDWRRHNKSSLNKAGKSSRDDVEAKKSEIESSGFDGVFVYKDKVALGDGQSLTDKQKELLISAGLSTQADLRGWDSIERILRKARNFSEVETAYGYDLANSLPKTSRELIEVVAFSPAQIKSALGNTGQFSPGSNDIRFSIAPTGENEQDMADMRGRLSRIFDPANNYAGDKLADWRPTALGAFTLRQLSDMYGKLITLKDDTIKGSRKLTISNRRISNQVKSDVFHQSNNPIKDYDDLVHRMDADAARLMGGADEIAEKWATLDTWKDRIFGQPKVRMELEQIIADASYYEVHPDMDEFQDNPNNTPEFEAERKKAHKRLRAQYESMPERLGEAGGRAMLVYKEARDAFALHHDAMKDALMQRILRSNIDGLHKKEMADKIRGKFEEQKKYGPYFPFSRDGQYTMQVFHEPDERGNDYSFYGFASKAEMRKEAAKERLKGRRVVEGVQIDAAKELKQVSSAFLTDVMNIVGNGKDNDQLYQLYLQYLPDLSGRKHFIHRSNIQGWNPRMLRTFSQSMFHGAKQVARIRFGDLLERQLNLMETGYHNARAGSGETDDLIAAGHVINEFMKRHELIMNPPGAWWAYAANNLGFLWHLAASPAAAVVNMAQTPMVAIPIIASRFAKITLGGKEMDGYSAATKLLAQTTAQFVKGVRKDTPGFFSLVNSDAITQDERAALNDVIEGGHISMTQSHDLAGRADDAGKYGTRDVLTRVNTVMGYMFHHTERANREITFMVGYRMARAAGMGQREAINTATTLMYEGHGDYSSNNRARYMRGNVARVITQFRSYSQFMTYLWGRSLRQAVKGESQEVRDMARRQLVGMTAMGFTMTGLLGLPLVTTVLMGLSVLATGLSDDDEPVDLENDLRVWAAANMPDWLGGRKGAEVLLKGAPRAGFAGDLHGRIGSQSLWFRESDRELGDKDWAGYYLEQAMGPSISIAKRIMEGSRSLLRAKTNDDRVRALELAMPKFITDPMKAYRYADKGIQTRDGDMVLEPTVAETFLKLSGFSPARYSELSESRTAVKNAEKSIAEARQKLMSRYWVATRFGDEAERREVVGQIKQFNLRNKSWPITGTTIRNSVKSHIKTSGRMSGGYTLNPRLRGLRERGEFVAD